jgi:hypothetical protein
MIRSMSGQLRAVAVAVAVLAIAVVVYRQEHHLRTDSPGGPVALFAPSPAIGGSERAVVIEPTPPKGIGSQITAGSHVDVTAATHGEIRLRELYGNMYVLDASSSAGTVTLRATLQQAGRLVYASVNDRLVVRLHR